jgi:hypothetical protein
MTQKTKWNGLIAQCQYVHMEAFIPRILMPWKVFVQTKDELFGED